VSDDPLMRIAEAVDATVAAGSARLELTIEHRLTPMPASAPSPAMMFQGALAPMRPLARRVGRRVEKALIGPKRAEGLVDFGHRLVALDYGFRAELIEDGREWSGRAGGERSHGRGTSADWQQPLWLIDLLRGVVEAVPRGRETIRDRSCLRLAARADLITASRAAPGPMAVPPVPRYQELGRLPVDCWIDETLLVRRLRIELQQPVGEVAVTLDLVEFGVPVPRDWPNLPRLGTRREAAR
jgi:hypothetical protein